MAVAFARFLGVLVPAVFADGLDRSADTAFGEICAQLSWQQLIAILLILFSLAANTRGLRLGKWIQNVFTSAKTIALVAFIVLGICSDATPPQMHANFSGLWAIQGAQMIRPGADFLRCLGTVGYGAAGAFGLFVAFGVAQVGSLFSADAWNNITFTAGEVKNPRRDVPLVACPGHGIVITLYILANMAISSLCRWRKFNPRPTIASPPLH